MKNLLIIVLMFVSLSVVGQQIKMVSIPETELTEQQKAQLKIDAVNNDITMASEWAGKGKEIGIGFREVLTAISDVSTEFASTNLGMFAMGLVAYHVVGTDIAQLVIGIPFTIFVNILWIVFLIKKVFSNSRIDSINYHENGKLKNKEYTGNNRFNPEQLMVVWFFYTISNGLCLLVTLV